MYLNALGQTYDADIMFIVKLTVKVGKYRSDGGAEELFVGSLQQSNCFPSSQFSEKNVQEVEVSLLSFEQCKLSYCFLSCRLGM